MKVKIIFSEDGKAACIQFANGSESFDFESKEEAIFSIKECAKRKKITKQEEEDLIKEILLSSLPDTHADFFLLPLGLMLLLNQTEEETEEPERIINPYVEICECGVKLPHAYIYNNKNEKVSPPFITKNDGLSYVEYLLSKGHITEEDSIHLNVLIDILPFIIEDAKLN